MSSLDFSPTGNLIVSIGKDEMNSIAIYRWRDRSAVFTSQGSVRPIIDCRFLGFDDNFGVCGEDFIHFWTLQKDSFDYTRHRGLFGKKTPRQTMNCLAYINGMNISGSSTGDLCIWEGRACTRTIQVHTAGSIVAMHVAARSGDIAGGLCAATSDGRIHMYNKDLELWSTFNTTSYGGIDKRIHSICWNPHLKRVLVGLVSCEIFEVSDLNGKVIGTITTGHAGAYVKGLAPNPIDEDQVATVGSDKTLRIWHAEQHSCTRMVVLDSQAMCVSYSHNGTRLIVGLGKGEDGDERKEGAYLVFKEKDLSLLHQARDCKKALTDCKSSKDGKLFAFGSRDHCIYVYQTQDYALLARMKGHTGPITRIDFGCAPPSNDSEFLQSNSKNGEIMFWAVSKMGKKLTPMSQRNTYFETQSCSFGWSVKETHGCSDGSIINCNSRSNKGDSLVTIDNVGRIRLYQYPVISKNPFQCIFRGHAADISNVHFSKADKWLFTVGAEDCCLFQWRHVRDDVESHPVAKNIVKNADLISGADLDRQSSWEKANELDMTHIFQFEEVEEDNNNCGVTRPWRRAIVAPSTPEKKDGSLPDSELELQWIHGYSASKCRGNLLYGKDSLLYNVGRTLVKYDVREKKQLFHTAKEEVLCIALHPHSPICALGQAGKFPRVDIVDYTTMKSIQIIEGHHRRAISSLKFDAVGKFLVAVGQDSHNTMTVHDWINGTVIALSPTSESKTLDIEFQRDGKGIVQCGDSLLRFWTISGNELNFKNAFFGDQGKVSHFVNVSSHLEYSSLHYH